jgi:hypothetical protein
MTAINSHVLVEIAREAARLQPDVFILYIGNNEVVGPYGPGTVFGPFSDSPFVTRARVRATRLRLAQLLRSAWTRRPGTRSAPDAWEGLAMFAQRQLPADDPRLDGVRRQFRANIAEILALARRAGAEVLLCTVAVNLRDCPPFAGDDARRIFARRATWPPPTGSTKPGPPSNSPATATPARPRRQPLNGILREIGQAANPPASGSWTPSAVSASAPPPKPPATTSFSTTSISISPATTPWRRIWPPPSPGSPPCATPRPPPSGCRCPKASTASSTPSGANST